MNNADNCGKTYTSRYSQKLWWDFTNDEHVKM